MNWAYFALHPLDGMKKNFSLNLFFLLGINLLIKPVYLFGIEVGVQNAVGPAEYGLYYAMFNFTFLFNVVLDMGINNFQKIKVAEDTASGIQNMATLIPLKVVLALVYMLVTVSVAAVIGFDDRYWFFIGWIMLNQVLSAFLLLLRANLSGLHLFVRDSILSVTDRLILIGGIGYLLLFGTETFRIEWFVLFQTGAYVAAILLAIVLLPAGSRFPKLNFSRSAAMQMVKDTWPFALLILLMTAYNKLDGVMLERLGGDGLVEAGIYAQAYRILDAGNSFAFLYAGLLLPMFARLMQQGGQGVSTLVNQASRLLIVPAGMVLIICFFHADWLMQLLYKAQVDASSNSLRWLMGSFLFISSGYVYGTLITASGKMKALNLTAFLAVVLNVVLNFWLIPEYGSEGAAMASFFSLGAMALAQIVIVFAARDLKTDSSSLFSWGLRGVLVLAALASVGWALQRLGFSGLAAFLILAGAAALLFLFFVFRKSDLKDALPE